LLQVRDEKALATRQSQLRAKEHVMRIDGLPNLQKASQPNQRTDATRARDRVGQGGDSVEISRPTQDAAELTKTLKAAPEAINPRLGEIRERVQSGFYNTEGARREIAGALLDTDSIRPVVNEVVEVRSAQKQLADVPDVRQDRVAESRERVASGFYDQSDVRSQTAQSIIDESA
jgi:anti-sigma28 factor (negative regulator of flagellin synthesis)